ncbi:hypothetical protein SLA2020_526650 [Shorea laevis]
MNFALLRSGSVPVPSPALPGSPKVHLSRHDSGVFSGERNSSSSKNSLHLETNGRKDRALIRRAMSEETDVFQPESTGISRCSKSTIPEEEHVADVEVPGDGCGGGRFGDRSKIGDYYRDMLKLNAGDSLLLRNYGKYLHEVENDVEKAEEYYGRAILASPGDGEVLSLYGKLIWETQKDEERAKAYFDRAVFASPGDCMVLGSYAHFMWEAEEDEVEEEEEEGEAGVSPTMVTAF